MTFLLYHGADDEMPFWRENWSEVDVRGGHFEVMIGTGEDRLPGLPEHVYMGILIDGEEMEPRTRLARYRSVVQG